MSATNARLEKEYHPRTQLASQSYQHAVGNMAGVLCLPAELVLEVLSHISASRDLLNLCLVCKELLGLCEPIVYRRLDTTHYEGSIRPVLRKLIQAPQLAQHVRKLELRACDDPAKAPRHVSRKAPDMLLTDSTLLWCAAERVGLIQTVEDDSTDHYELQTWIRKDWAESTAQGEEAADIALLIAILPNVEELLWMLPHHLSSWWHNVWTCTNGPRKLRSLEVRSAIWSDSDALSRLLPNLEGLDLQILKADRCRLGSTESNCSFYIDSWSKKYRQLAPRSLNITTLNLHQSRCFPRDVQKVVEACTRLQAFSFEWAEPTSRHLITFVAPSQIKEMLLCHQSSLKRLRVCYRDTAQPIASWKDSGLGSLHAFTSLESLETCPYTLTDKWNVCANSRSDETLPKYFPPSLKELQLEESSVPSVTASLVNKLVDRTVSLKVLRIKLSLYTHQLGQFGEPDDLINWHRWRYSEWRDKVIPSAKEKNINLTLQVQECSGKSLEVNFRNCLLPFEDLLLL